VFGLLDRMEEAGADLVEFAAGAGEVLRALLMLQVGAKPEGLTEVLQQTLERHQSQLAPGDLLRMLKLLGESESMIRRGGKPRLAVEILLLRWALMDRTVDLESVLAGQPGSAVGRPGGSATAGRVPTRESPSPTGGAAGESPSRRPAEPSAPRAVEFTVDALLAAWPELVAAARDQSRFLGEALAAARPVAAQPPDLTLAIPDGNPIHLEALGRQRDSVEGLLGTAVGGLVRLVVTDTAAGGATPAPRARRLSETEARAERLRVLKSRDPALEAAADSLDLEVLD
jgi:DNA polymerase-3 subunit gamma/tau